MDGCEVKYGNMLAVGIQVGWWALLLLFFFGGWGVGWGCVEVWKNIKKGRGIFLVSLDMRWVMGRKSKQKACSLFLILFSSILNQWFNRMLQERHL